MSPSIDPAALMEGWKVVGVGPGFWTPGQERGWITSLLTLPNPSTRCNTGLKVHLSVFKVR